jgi:hypothetical protein
MIRAVAAHAFCKTVQCAVVVERPVHTVFDYLADVGRHHEWNTALERTELLDPGPTGEGTRAVEVRRILGREVRSPFVITRHVPPSRQDFHTTDGPVRPDGVMRCVEDPRGTRASYQLTLRGPLAHVFAFAIGREMPKNLANVKRILESSPAP